MMLIAVLALLSAAAAYPVEEQLYSFSSLVGSSSNNAYSITGEGRITAVRVWEGYNSYITGIQLCYDSVWSQVAGIRQNTAQEISLFDGEDIVEVSGKYTTYIQSLVFTTSMGRTLIVGQPAGRSFNLFPDNKNTVLRFLSGGFSRGITSIGAHWALCPP